MIGAWKERLPEIIQGYTKDTIFNMDETGLFWHALPDRGFGQKSRSYKGGKRSKHRLTIPFFVLASGKKEKPVNIVNLKNPGICGGLTNYLCQSFITAKVRHR